MKGLESSPRPLPSSSLLPDRLCCGGSPCAPSTPDTKQMLQLLAVRSLDTKYFCFVVSRRGHHQGGISVDRKHSWKGLENLRPIPSPPPRGTLGGLFQCIPNSRPLVPGAGLTSPHPVNTPEASHQPGDQRRAAHMGEAVPAPEPKSEMRGHTTNRGRLPQAPSTAA